MHAANETIKCRLKKVHLFFLCKEGLWGWSFKNNCVPNLFPYVPHVPNVLPKGLPNSTSIYSISFPQSSPLLTDIGELQREAFYLHIWIASLGEPYKCFFSFWWWANQHGPLHKITRTWKAAHLMNCRENVNRW